MTPEVRDLKQETGKLGSRFIFAVHDLELYAKCHLHYFKDLTTDRLLLEDGVNPRDPNDVTAAQML